MELEIEYSPRYQFVPFHQRSQRWSCLVVHRRGGKTVACVNDLGARAIYTHKKEARYAYIAPYYRQAKDVAWSYVKQYLKPMIRKVRESELRVELINDAWITLYGADNPDALRGIYLDGVVLDEFGDSRPSLWGSVILPTLVDRNGWAVFIGTPKGKNHFYKIYERSKKEAGWFNLTLKASESGIIAKSELGEIRAQMTEEEWEQEMECSFTASVKGTYYSDLITQLENKRQIAPGLQIRYNEPVFVATDLGYTDSTALWFWQLRPDGIAMIDYEEHSGQPLQFYFDLLDKKKYKYQEIWLPHDSKSKTLQTGRSTLEQFIQQGFPVRLAPKLSIQDGINAARLIMPTVWFDSVRCYDGIEALRAYKRQFNEVTNSFSDHPLHDWSSNGADGFRVFSTVTKPKKLMARSEDELMVSGWTLDELFDDYDRSRINTGEILRI